MKEGVDPEWRRHPGDSRRWASTRVRPRQQGSTGSSTRHRATALADTLRKGGACGERWTARTGPCATGHGSRRQGQALVSGVPARPANPQGCPTHRHDGDRGPTSNKTHLYDLARQGAGGEVVRRHHGAQAARGHLRSCVGSGRRWRGTAHPVSARYAPTQCLPRLPFGSPRGRDAAHRPCPMSGRCTVTGRDRAGAACRVRRCCPTAPRAFRRRTCLSACPGRTPSSRSDCVPSVHQGVFR